MFDTWHITNNGQLGQRNRSHPLDLNRALSLSLSFRTYDSFSTVQLRMMHERFFVLPICPCARCFGRTIVTS